MKIVETQKEVKPITFADIKVGDVFRLPGDPKYHMKTKEFNYDFYDLFGGEYVASYRNTVCLSNGEITRTANSTKVTPVDCELIIK